MGERMKLGIDTIIGIPEAARLAEEPERTIRDRLTKLDARLRREGRPGILVRFGSRSWSVRLEALQAELRTRGAEPEEPSSFGLDSLEAKFSALLESHRRLRNIHEAEKRRQAKRWEAHDKADSRPGAGSEPKPDM